jgi:hypothetical protein
VDRFNAFLKEVEAAAGLFAGRVRKGHLSVTVVHHNDADGIAGAAALSHAFDRTGIGFRLLPVEKVHEPIIERIHADTAAVILYADLGGQSSGLIGRHAGRNPQVIILDHHLPGGEVPANVIHLNPERSGISGDADASGASVCALFAGELLKEASLSSPEDEALTALLGVLGAIGDGQVHEGSLTGINRMLLSAAIKQGVIAETTDGYVIPRFLNKTAREVVEMLNLLGSVGFYSGSAETGVDFLLGRDSGGALRISGRLKDLEASCFRKEAEAVRRQGLAGSDHFQWVDIKDRFVPMGVKAVGLFLEHLISEGLSAPEKYLIGFQHLPLEMPGIGLLEESLTKVSARVHPKLKESIQRDRLPDFMTLIPQATARVQGTADGCHRFKAASLIEQGQEAEFLQALEEVLARET